MAVCLREQNSICVPAEARRGLRSPDACRCCEPPEVGPGTELMYSRGAASPNCWANSPAPMNTFSSLFPIGTQQGIFTGWIRLPGIMFRGSWSVYTGDLGHSSLLEDFALLQLTNLGLDCCFQVSNRMRWSPMAEQKLRCPLTSLKPPLPLSPEAHAEFSLTVPPIESSDWTRSSVEFLLLLLLLLLP